MMVGCLCKSNPLMAALDMGVAFKVDQFTMLNVSNLNARVFLKMYLKAIM